MDVVDQLMDVLRTGSQAVCGERVSRFGRALQCALFAEKSQAEPALVAAALLHDIGAVPPSG